MKLTEDIKPITFMKTNSADLIRLVNTNQRPIVITQNGEAKAVLQDIESYEKQKELFMLLKIVAQGEQDIKNNKLVEHENLFTKLDKKFKNAN